MTKPNKPYDTTSHLYPSISSVILPFPEHGAMEPDGGGPTGGAT